MSSLSQQWCWYKEWGWTILQSLNRSRICMIQRFDFSRRLPCVFHKVQFTYRLTGSSIWFTNSFKTFWILCNNHNYCYYVHNYVMYSYNIQLNKSGWIEFSDCVKILSTTVSISPNIPVARWRTGCLWKLLSLMNGNLCLYQPIGQKFFFQSLF